MRRSAWERNLGRLKRFVSDGFDNPLKKFSSDIPYKIYISYKNFSKRPFWRCERLKAGRHKKERVKEVIDFFGNVWYNINIEKRKEGPL